MSHTVISKSVEIQKYFFLFVLSKVKDLSFQSHSRTFNILFLDATSSLSHFIKINITIIDWINITVSSHRNFSYSNPQTLKYSNSWSKFLSLSHSIIKINNSKIDLNLNYIFLIIKINVSILSKYINFFLSKH